VSRLFSFGNCTQGHCTQGHCAEGHWTGVQCPKSASRPCQHDNSMNPWAGPPYNVLLKICRRNFLQEIAAKPHQFDPDHLRVWRIASCTCRAGCAIMMIGGRAKRRNQGCPHTRCRSLQDKKIRRASASDDPVIWGVTANKRMCLVGERSHASTVHVTSVRSLVSGEFCQLGRFGRSSITAFCSRSQSIKFVSAVAKPDHW
jgi:hypothetical protein